MKYFVVFFFSLISISAFSQIETISGNVVNDNTYLPLWNINVVNINLAKGATTDQKGYFESNRCYQNASLPASMPGRSQLLSAEHMPH